MRNTLPLDAQNTELFEENLGYPVVTERNPWQERFVYALAATILLALPLFYGGKHYIAFGFTKFAIFGLCAAIAVSFLRNPNLFGTKLALAWSSLAAKMLLSFLVATLIIAFQLVPLPLALLEIISPEAAGRYATAGSSWGRLSLAPAETLSGLLSFLAVALMGLGVILLPHRYIRSRVSNQPKKSARKGSDDFLSRMRRIDYAVDYFQRIIIMSGLICSLIALFHLTFGKAKLFGMFDPERASLSITRAHWPFVNPNHLSVLLVIAIVLSATRILRLLQIRSLSRTRPARSTTIGLALLRHPERLEAHFGQLFATLIMIICCVLTLSRMGNVLMLGGLVAIWLYYQTISRRLKGARREDTPRAETKMKPLASLLGRARQVCVVIGLLLALLFFLGQGGRERLADRIEYGLASDESLRTTLASSTMDVIGQFPLFGAGLGAWPYAITAHVPAQLAGWTLDYAHNDYLQVASELGATGFILILVVFYFVVKATLKAWKTTLLPTDRLLLFGSSLALTLPLIHAAVDFPFHIPALGFMFVLLLAVHIRLVSISLRSDELSDRLSSALHSSD